MRKLDTRVYNSELDAICKSDNPKVFIRTDLIKRLTYGEYENEPKNGFQIGIESPVVSILDLDKCEVYVDDEINLNDNQKMILSNLKNDVVLGDYNSVLEAISMAITLYFAGYYSSYIDNDEEFIAVIQAFMDLFS
ncbi:TPA: hypothetical protein QFP15_000500 [Enterococcus faecium]